MRKLIRISIFCAILTFLILIVARFLIAGENKATIKIASKITKSTKSLIEGVDRKLDNKLAVFNETPTEDIEAEKLELTQPADPVVAPAEAITPPDKTIIAKNDLIQDARQAKPLPAKTRIATPEVTPKVKVTPKTIEPQQKIIPAVKTPTRSTTSRNRNSLPAKVDPNLGLRQRMLEAEARRLEQELRLTPNRKPAVNRQPKSQTPKATIATPAPTPRAIAKPTPKATPAPTPKATPVATTKPTPNVPKAVKASDPLPRKQSNDSQTSFEDIKGIIDSYGIPNIDSEELSNTIIIESNKNGIDPLLTTAIIYLESTFNRYAKSETGKVGLMQIYPSDAKKISEKLNLPYLGNITLFHPLYNVKLGLYKLKSLVENAGGDLATGIKEYSRISSATKAETDLNSTEYLKKILQITADYRTRLKK